MKLYAIYNRGPHTSAMERAWYGPENGYYDYTGWPKAVTHTPSLRVLSKMSKAFEVAGKDPHSGGTAWVVRDEDYYERQSEMQEWVHHTTPKIRMAAIFTDENEAKAAYPKAEIRKYEIGW